MWPKWRTLEPVESLLGAFRGPPWGSWGPLGALWGGPLWSLLWASWRPLGASWRPLGASSDPLGAENEILNFLVALLGPLGASSGPSFGPLGRLLGVLGPSRYVLGPSWGCLGGLPGCLGALLRASWAVLERRKSEKARKPKTSKNTMENQRFWPLGALLGSFFGASWDVLGASWAVSAPS